MACRGWVWGMGDSVADSNLVVHEIGVLMGDLRMVAAPAVQFRLVEVCFCRGERGYGEFVP